eukprot:6039081-Lingulodinium_polyedra.AAC.1
MIGVGARRALRTTPPRIERRVASPISDGVNDYVISGYVAQVCVCLAHYAFASPTLNILRQLELATVTGGPMQMSGEMFADDYLGINRWMCVQYKVTDVYAPVMAVFGLNNVGDDLH